jgi:hypothetical protein
VTHHHRLLSLGLLLILSCTAMGRTSQEMEGLDRETWPKEITTPTLRITVYKPELDSLKGNRIRLRSAFSALKEGGSEPVFGAFWMAGILDVADDRKTGSMDDARVADVRFPRAAAQDGFLLREALDSDLPRWKLSWSMADLFAELKALEQRKAQAAALKADIPQILFRDHPAVLLSIEGEPAWRAVEGTAFRRLANAAFFVLQDPALEKCYLHVPPYWWTATAPTGPWEAIEDAPDAVGEIWARELRPEPAESDSGQEATPRPEVLVATQPSELIWTDGKAQFVPLSGTNLLYVKNSDSDVFLEIEMQTTYVLLSGRWYRTPAQRTAWEYVPSDRLPEDFSRIPLSSEKAHVLACVDGTPQAHAAVLDAEVPRTEAVKPGPAPEMQASYDGDPQFAAIDGSAVEYAVNTPASIFCVGRRYYWCNDGIWYDSDLAIGPWYVCSWVPPAIYLIPPSCPYYYVTYCRVFSVTPSAIWFGYYPGYRGCYVWGRTIVYGTGWRYRCWSGSAWYPRPVTWGVGVRYNSFSCSWGYRYGGYGTCAWTGLRRPSLWRAPVVTVEAGGRWAGTGYRSVSNYRNAAPAAPVSLYRSDSLYSRQPARLIRPVAPETPRTGRQEGTPVPPATGRREIPRPPSAPPRHDEPARAPVPPRHEDPRPPRTPEPQPPARYRENPPAPPAPWENPRTPPPAPRENPRTPERENPRTPPPAPREHRESPRTPPPPPPPRERREEPRTPPPPREHREAPRNPPPPPPPQREYRDAPKSPPPREHREAPRNPPQRDQREAPRSQDRRK